MFYGLTNNDMKFINDINAFNNWFYNTEAYKQFLYTMTDCFIEDLYAIIDERNVFDSTEEIGYNCYVLNEKCKHDISEIHQYAQNIMEYSQYKNNLVLILNDKGFKLTLKY